MSDLPQGMPGWDRDPYPVGRLVQVIKTKEIQQLPSWAAKEAVDAGLARYAQICYVGAGPALAEVEHNDDPEWVTIYVQAEHRI